MSVISKCFKSAPAAGTALVNNVLRLKEFEDAYISNFGFVTSFLEKHNDLCASTGLSTSIAQLIGGPHAFPHGGTDIIYMPHHGSFFVATKQSQSSNQFLRETFRSRRCTIEGNTQVLGTLTG